MIYYNPHITGYKIPSPTNPLNNHNQGPLFSIAHLSRKMSADLKNPSTNPVPGSPWYLDNGCDEFLQETRQPRQLWIVFAKDGWVFFREKKIYLGRLSLDTQNYIVQLSFKTIVIFSKSLCLESMLSMLNLQSVQYKHTKMCGPQIRELGGKKTWDTSRNGKKKHDFTKPCASPPEFIDECTHQYHWPSM